MSSSTPRILSKQKLTGKALTPREKSKVALGVQKRRLKEQQSETTKIWKAYNEASGSSPTFESEMQLAEQYGPQIEESNRKERFYSLRRNRILANLRQINPTWDDDLLATYYAPP